MDMGPALCSTPAPSLLPSWAPSIVTGSPQRQARFPAQSASPKAALGTAGPGMLFGLGGSLAPVWPRPLETLQDTPHWGVTRVRGLRASAPALAGPSPGPGRAAVPTAEGSVSLDCGPQLETDFPLQLCTNTTHTRTRTHTYATEAEV